MGSLTMKGATLLKQCGVRSIVSEWSILSTTTPFRI